MTRMFFFLLGFGFMVIGFTYIITYLNLLSMGYSLLDYFKFIISRVECWFSIVGFLLVFLSIFTKGYDKNDIYL